MYDTLNKGKDLGDRKKAYLRDSQIFRKPDDPDQYELVHPKLSIKFSIKGNKLLRFEESRHEELKKQMQLRDVDKFSNYEITIDFKNLKHVWIMRDMNWKRDPRETRNCSQMTILFQLKRPCEAMKFTAWKKESDQDE